MNKLVCYVLMTITLALQVSLSIGKTKKLDEYFKVCKRNDPAINECVRTSTVAAKPILLKGIPELGLPSLNPLVIPVLETKEGNGGIQLKQKFTNLTIYGLEDYDVVESKVEKDISSIFIDLRTPFMLMKTHYFLDGRILSLPISGDGEGTLNFTNVKTAAKVPLKTITKNGVEYLEAQRFNWVIEVEKISLHFTNLFNGDKTLGDTMNRFLNENWKEAFETYRYIPEEGLGAVFESFANRVFRQYPLDIVFPNK